MKDIARLERHPAEAIVDGLRQADELAAEGKTREEIAADLRVSAGDVVQLGPPLRRHLGEEHPSQVPDDSRVTQKRNHIDRALTSHLESHRRFSKPRELAPAVNEHQ